MMVNRRHAEDPFPAQLERAYLQNYRKRLNHKNAADKKQKNFLLDDHGDYTKRSAER